VCVFERVSIPSPTTATVKMSNANASTDDNKLVDVKKMPNVNVSASADNNKLGGVGALSRSTTPTLSQAQYDEGSFPNPRHLLGLGV
jgi:hypothetical protein